VHGIPRTIVHNTHCDVWKYILGSTRWPSTFWGSNSPKTLNDGLL